MNAWDTALLRADAAEEQSAAAALRAATTQDELISSWWRDCDAFQGAARERLQEVYAMKLREWGGMVG